MRVVDTTDRTFLLHVGGKIEQRNKQPLKTRDDLSMAYTPGVARVCMAIAEDRDKAFQYTIKRNTVAVVSDGTAVLGLGDIGPEAAMPVMEGKAMLFKEFAGVDAFPICLDTKDPDEIVETVQAHRAGLRRHQPRGHLRAALLRDRGPPEGRSSTSRSSTTTSTAPRSSSSPRCSTPASSPAASSTDLRVLVTGLGAAGVAVTKILMEAGVRDIVGADSQGPRVDRARRLRSTAAMNAIKRWYAEATNPDALTGAPADALEGADLFIGLSGARIFPAEALRRMNDDAMVFAMANPTPGGRRPRRPRRTRGSWPPGARTTPTRSTTSSASRASSAARSTSARAQAITEEMKMAAARAIARIIPESELREDYIVPSVFNRDVSPGGGRRGGRAGQGAGHRDGRRRHDRLRGDRRRADAVVELARRSRRGRRRGRRVDEQRAVEAPLVDRHGRERVGLGRRRPYRGHLAAWPVPPRSRRSTSIPRSLSMT